jgi:hypothetical protein
MLQVNREHEQRAQIKLLNLIAMLAYGLKTKQNYKRTHETTRLNRARKP